MSQTATTVSVINAHLANGALIAEFRGTIVSLYKLKSGGEGDRAWTKQDAELTDREGSKIIVNFWLKGREIDQSWKGREIFLRSVKGEKGTHGVTVYDDEYNGKTTRKLKVTGAADLGLMGGDPAPQQQEAPASQPATTTSHTSQPATQSRPANSKPATTKEARTEFTNGLKGKIFKRATVWNLCLDAAVASAHSIQSRHNYAMLPQGIFAHATGLYIDTMKTMNASDLDLVDTSAIDWKSAAGKTLRDHVTELDRQVMQHHAAKQPATTAPPNTQEAALEAFPPGLDDQDEIPF